MINNEEIILPAHKSDKIDCLTHLDTSSDVISRQSPFDYQSLFNSFHELKKPILFKGSIQNYQLNIFRKLSEFSLDDPIEKGQTYIIHERGKIRCIVTTPISVRVPVHSLCVNCLIPTLKKYLIYDNCASLKGRGIEQQRQRLKVHLMRYHRQHKTNQGYVLLGDFSKYFDNLDHKKVMLALKEKIRDPVILDYVQRIINNFCPDLSKCSDEEIKSFEENKAVFNSINYPRFSKKSIKTIHKSVDIGSEVSQIIGVFYPTRLDNYVKIVKSCKFYGRYMDDFYIIHSDLMFLKQLEKQLFTICKELGIFLNPHKTHIVKLEKGFKFLKIKYLLTKTGKVIMRQNSAFFKRETAKLKALKRLMLKNKVSFNEIELQFRSWIGNAKRFNNQKSVQQSINFYKTTFRSN